MSPPVADSTKDVEKIEKKLAQRRINKPLIEKRRRARINDCLAQLKAIVLEASDTSQSPRPSKLEKADILEMTVDFIKKRVPTTDNTSKSIVTDDVIHTTPTSDTMDEFTAGYSKCLQEISGFLEKTQTLNESIKQNVVSHISQKLQNKKQQSADTKYQMSSNKKIPITPIKKRTIEEVVPNKKPEVIDLSVNVDQNVDQTTNQNQPLDLSKTAEALSHDSDSSAISNQNPQMPLGLLCGGQIMLLVQVPPSWTSQQYLTQSMASQNSSLLTTVIDNRTHPLPSIIIPPSTASSVSNTKDSVDKTIDKSECDADNNTNRVPVYPVITAGTQNGPYLPEHWRPW